MICRRSTSPFCRGSLYYDAVLIDSHAHLAFEQFAIDLPDVLKRAEQAGVCVVITVGTDAASSRRSMQLTDTYDHLFCTAGIHPHEASKFEKEQWPVLEHLWQQPRVVAVGETGLDYYYAFSEPADQRALFARHLEASAECGLPLVIHVRDAYDDAFMLIEQAGLVSGGVLHCFSGGPSECDRALQLGLAISLSGIVTFPGATRVREAVPMIPDDRLLVETDAPYLAPVPRRGKRNEPSWVVHTAKRVAEIRGVDFEHLCRQTRENTIRLFGLAMD
jgi:TatD DNase family protein